MIGRRSISYMYSNIECCLYIESEILVRMCKGRLLDTPLPFFLFSKSNQS